MAAGGVCRNHGRVPQVGGILIVDDDASFRQLLRSLLEASGLAVAGEAANGVEAVELAGRLQPAAVTMDLDMPVKSGAAATREICSGGSPTIVIVSGSESSEQVAEAMAAGARWHVAKRDVNEQLVPVLNALLEEPQSQ
jgi:CheY-like chemotaxis protein